MAVEPNMARRMWHVVRAVLFMLRKGVSKRKLTMDLHLLLQRGKIAGKALGNLMTAHGHHDKAKAAEAAVPPAQQFSCRALDLASAVYNPRGVREVEFSCSNTPSYPSLHLIPTGKRRRRGNNRRSHRGANGAEPGWYNYDAADIARVFEILNNNEHLLSGGGGDDTGSPGAEQPSPLALIATPSPTLWASFGRTPAHVRQLRITDSPFPLRDDAAGDGGEVDMEAEEFIKKFYEQLRTQQSLAAATPDCGYGSYGGYARPVSGIA
ncbi:hypothetical protein SEVIR_4G149800v4 [Setaria viridis]|uniref:Uncharacterized protein n=1 Tax=Setaria viridis TaxID=4556 RepID=A0A4U6UYV7_SETVI|nr:uncharacterized protein LOC117851601 [Setaria viridis]TKW21880.1 hypothetical protein SEVIR_4G149800v2 [Setaria viridis]